MFEDWGNGEKSAAAIVAIVLVAVAFFLLQPKPAAPTGAASESVFYEGPFVLRVASESGEPVAEALVNYSLGSERGGGLTGANGTLEIVIKRSAPLSLRVEKTGFETAVLTVIATKREATVKLKAARVVEPAEFAPPQAEGIAVVTASNEQGEPVESGEARIYGFEGAHLLGESTVSGGNAVVENLPLDANAYLVVEAPGFLSFDGSGAAKKIVAVTEFSAVLKAEANNSQKTVLRAVDPNGTLVPCSMTVLAPPAVQLFTRLTQGELEYDAPSNGSFYFVSVADGFLPAKSALFKAGETAQVAMQAPTAANSAVLRVRASDDSGKSVQAKITVRDSKGFLAAPESKTVATLTLAKGDYVVAARFKSQEQRKTVKLYSSDANVDFEFAAAKAFVNATARNAASNAFLNASVSAEQGGKAVASGYAGEKLEIAAGRETVVRLEAKGFVAAETSVQPLKAGETSNVELFLQPKASAGGTSIKFVKAVDANGTQVDTLVQGGRYKLYFEFEPSAAAQEAGAAVRVEGGEITDYPQGYLVEKSSSYSQQSGACVDLAQDKVLGGAIKWVDSRFKPAVKTLEYSVTVDNASRELAVEYRGYSIDANGAWERDPADAALAEAESSREKAGCYAATRSLKLAVTKSGGAANASPTPQAENASFWVEGGELKTNVKEIVFSVDSVLDADAVAVSLEGDECKLLYSFESSNATENCYGYSDGFAWFKSADFGNPACPLKARGNSADGDASAKLVVTGSCVKESKLEIPLRVNARPEESLSARPRELAGDYSAKLIYIIENRQAGQARKVSIGGRELSFDAPEAKPIAWNGPGSLEALSNGAKIASWQYASEKSYFAGKGDLGPRAESCGDWLCCASAWCNQDALSQAAQEFKERAREVARRTAFRRGNGQPLKALGMEKFVFVTVAQVTEDASKQLKSLGFSAGTRASLAGDSCKPGNPVVLELKAETSDGATWQYSSRVLRLENNLKAPLNKLALCDFLHGDNAFINKTEQATLASLAQSSDRHSTPIPVPSFFTDVTGAKARCLAAVGTCAEQSGVMVNLPALSTSPLTAKVNCVPLVSGKCAPACEESQGDVQIVPYNNQQYVLLRFGLTPACSSTPPSLQGVFANLESSAIMRVLGGYAGTAQRLGAQFYAAASDPSTYTQSQLSDVLARLPFGGLG